MLLTEQNILILQFVVLIFFFFFTIFTFLRIYKIFFTLFTIFTRCRSEYFYLLLQLSSELLSCVDVVPDNGRGGGGNSMGMATE